jgi:hypothetical protein
MIEAEGVRTTNYDANSTNNDVGLFRVYYHLYDYSLGLKTRCRASSCEIMKCETSSSAQ